MPADEAQGLYNELLLMSDNRCSLHRASEWDEATQVRRLHRIIMIDDKVPY